MDPGPIPPPPPPQGPIHSDRIPGRDQAYADSKHEEFLSNRRQDLWGEFLDSGRRMPENFPRRRQPFSRDLEDTVRDQQHNLQPILQDALRCLKNDPVCLDVLGPDIRLDQPLSQAQSSASRNGRREPSRIELQVRVQGARDSGLLDVFATDAMGITEMILTVRDSRGPRQIHVDLGVSSQYDIVNRSPPRDRGEGYLNPLFRGGRPAPDIMDAEFEVLGNNDPAFNQTRW